MAFKKNLTWNRFIKIWRDQFNISPEEANLLLKKHWLNENYTTTFGNMWKDRENRHFFKEIVTYVYECMEENNIHWRAALLKLFKEQDTYIINRLIFMNVPFEIWKPVTFAKYIGLWRSEFIVQGWLPQDEYFNQPMVKNIKLAEKKLKKSGLLSKKKKK